MSRSEVGFGCEPGQRARISSMLRRIPFRLCVLAAGFGLVLLLLTAGAQRDSSYRGRKYKAPPPMARIVVTLARQDDGKPIENAAVVFHAMENGKNTGNMELKTDEDGKSVIDVMPIGDTVELQIIARGYQTYGADYKIDKPQMAIEIRLKRPGRQYSIYQNHPVTAGAAKSPDADKPQHAPAGAAPGAGKSAGPAPGASSAPGPASASKDKPAAQPEAKAGASQPQPK